MNLNQNTQTQPSYEELLRTVASLKDELKRRPIATSNYELTPTLEEQLERISDDELLTVYQVPDAPYIVIGETIYKQLKRRRDKRYHVNYNDGHDGYVLLSDITEQALRYNLKPLQHYVARDSERPHLSTPQFDYFDETNSEPL